MIRRCGGYRAILGAPPPASTRALLLCDPFSLDDDAFGEIRQGARLQRNDDLARRGVHHLDLLGPYHRRSRDPIEYLFPIESFKITSSPASSSFSRKKTSQESVS